MDSFWELQTAVNLFLQSLGGWLETPMRLFTFLGEEQFFMLVMPVFYWCIDAALGLRLGIILLASSTLNGYLKLAFHTPRPYWIDSHVKAYVLEPSFGMPSGHSQNSASLWGRIAASAGWRWLQAGLIALIGMVGLSRLYLGVHFLSDVLSGWLLGAVLVLIVLKLEKPIAAWAGRLTLSQQVGAAFAVSIVLIGIFQAMQSLAAAVFPEQALPALWLENSKLAGSVVPLDPFSVEGVFTGGGTLFGLLAGAAWLRHAGGFSAAGKSWQLLLRYMLGVAGVLVIRFGLDMVFPDGADLLALSLRYVRYAAVGLWISAAAPWLFIQFRWAKQTQAEALPLPELAS